MISLLKKFAFLSLLNSCFFLILIVGIQNSATKGKVNFMKIETINLPISFIIGLSFISGSVVGGILSSNVLDIKKTIKGQ